MANKVDGNHYDFGTCRESIEVIAAVVSRTAIPRAEAYYIGNALKYLLRAGNKPSESWRDDVAKAENYLHRALHNEWIKLKHQTKQG